MTTAVIVQARMTSTRLPGKVLMKLAGKSVLYHVLARCRAIVGVDAVCCAVPNTRESGPVVAEAERLGVGVFRGSERDVLDRYYQAAKILDADVVMRVTSDCPLIDPALCTDMLSLRAREQADYACNNMPPSWPHGLDCEAVTYAWLERSAREARKKYEREHVTQYVRNHPEARKANLPGPGGTAVDHRWTLDTLADLKFLQALFTRLPAGPEGWGWRVPFAIVEAEPELSLINTGQDHHERLKKSMAEE